MLQNLPVFRKIFTLTSDLKDSCVCAGISDAGGTRHCLSTLSTLASFYFIQTNFYLLHPFTHHGPLCVLACWSRGGRLTGTRWSKEKSGEVCLPFTLSDRQVCGQLATELPLVAFLLHCLLSLTILSCFFRSISYIICGGSQLLLFLSLYFPW